MATMDGGGMEDLSDGVNKLTEFSAVLSSVTRTLDKNVRRLEDQFGKCNDSLKKMDETVAENSRVAQALKAENEAQLEALSEAASISSSLPEAAPPSESMLTKGEVMDIRSTSMVEREKEEEKNAVVMSEKEASLYAELTPWARIVDETRSADRIQTDKGVNMTVHKLNKSLRLPVMKETKEGEMKPETPDGAFPYPSIEKDTGVGPTLSAVIQRMHRLENAVSLQTGVNEALLKMVRDDTQTRAVYDTVVTNINTLHTDLREIGIGQTKIRSTLKGLADHVQEFEGSLEDVVPGGRLRVLSRKERGCKDEDGVDIEGGTILDGLDAYTVSESDRLEKRISVVENQLSSNGAMGVALRRLGNEVEELQNQMADRMEAEAALKKFQEENSSATFILKKTIEWSKTKWEAALHDINFALNHYNDSNGGRDHNLDESGDEEDEDDGEEEEGGGDEGDEEEGDDEEAVEEAKGGDDEKKDKGKKGVTFRSSDQDPEMIRKMNELFTAIEGGLNVNSFLVRDNVEETLDLLCPLLDDLTLKIEDIFATDKEIRFGGNSSKGSITLSELLTEDRKYNMRDVLYEALKSSIPVIDERVDKISMRRRIEKIEDGKVMQDEIKALEEKTEQVSRKISGIPTRDEMTLRFAQAAKKADLQKFRDVMFMRLDLNEEEIHALNAIVEETVHEMHDSQDEVHNVAFKSDHVGSSASYGSQKVMSSPGNSVMMMAPQGGGASNEEVKQMGTRVEMLLNQFKDLQADCATFIPREEVQEAMKAVLYEVKLLKMNSINVNKFNEEIEKKADYDEMKNLMEILSSALGDLMGKNVSAAAKSRCLMCDKPVSGAMADGRQSTRGRERSPSPSRHSANHPNRGPIDSDFAKSNNSLPEDVEVSRPGSSQPRLASSQSATNLPSRSEVAKANAKIHSEVTVLRNSIDLPAIDSGKPDARPPAKMMEQFKSRVRSAGGGGNVMY